MRRPLLILVVTLALAVGAAWVGLELVRPYKASAAHLVLEIPPGMHAPEVASLLVERGVLAHRFPFLVRYYLGRPRHHLKAGEYLFDRPERPLDIYHKLILGEVYLHPAVIPEGSDRFDIARILHQQLGVPPDDFLRVTAQAGPIRDLDPQAPSLEGYLFPDTYRLPRGVSAASAAAAMLARFRHVLETKLRADLEASHASLHDVVTLASLVEKETPDPAERPVVAGVFARRLEKGMPLQCDPTVIYAARLEGRPPGPITISELQMDSPYNTYRYAGLPPGPIASPGEASLRAALQPAPGSVLYFVANNHGGHIFARTLAEHQRNVARYRRALAALHPAAAENPSPRRTPSPRSHPGESHGRKQPSKAHPKTDHP